MYRAVIRDFSQSIDQLVSGPCIALEIRQENVVQSFKQLCGAYDPVLGKSSRGERDTLRALFGQDIHRNAVHCTDTPNEGTLECEFFFVLLPENLVGGQG